MTIGWENCCCSSLSWFFTARSCWCGCRRQYPGASIAGCRVVRASAGLLGSSRLGMVRKGFGFVERLAVLQAVVELADEFVEQMPGCGGVAVTDVLAGAGWRAIRLTYRG